MKIRNLYLASDSKARKELLKILGLNFKVIPTYVKEEKQKPNLSYAELVKRNALKKAMFAAEKLKKGIIIGADTIIVQDKIVYGKPKDLKEAKLMLKKLSQKAQWVYTGVAIIDKNKNKLLVDYEKAKVFMDELTDEEIENYFSLISPTKLAGGFDIQGKGAFFIRRIEGCFYNIVGLPLRKIYQMFKKLEIEVF
ncbi:MAG: nucleoside triphosphate pyrophosphatase [bacterium]